MDSDWRRESKASRASRARGDGCRGRRRFAMPLAGSAYRRRYHDCPSSPRLVSHGRRKWAPFFGLERQAAVCPASQSSDCSFCALSPRLLATEGRPPIWPRRPEQQRARKLGQSKAALIRTSLLARPVSTHLVSSRKSKALQDRGRGAPDWPALHGFLAACASLQSQSCAVSARCLF